MAEKWMVDTCGTLIDKETRDVYDYVDEICPILNQKEEQLKSLTKENRLLKITYAKCRDCKHADEYVPDYAYPYIIPKCKLNVKSIDYDSTACEDFEILGRASR